MEMQLETVLTSGRILTDRRLQAFMSATCIVGLAALTVLLFDASAAVGGSWLERLVVPGRMLLLVLTAMLLLRATGETWRDVGLRTPGSFWRTTGLVVGGYITVGAAFAAATQLLLPALGLEPKTAAAFAVVRGDLGEYLYWLIPVAWGSAAFGEELVFRGFLQSQLERLVGSVRGAPFLAAAGQASIFGALHAYQGAGSAILAGLTGFVIGLVYIFGRRNLWACIILHGLIDTISLTAIYLRAA
jgi:uncharacterized protein